MVHTRSHRRYFAAGAYTALNANGTPVEPVPLGPVVPADHVATLSGNTTSRSSSALRLVFRWFDSRVRMRVRCTGRATNLQPPPSHQSSPLLPQPSSSSSSVPIRFISYDGIHFIVIVLLQQDNDALLISPKIGASGIARCCFCSCSCRKLRIALRERLFRYISEWIAGINNNTMYLVFRNDEIMHDTTATGATQCESRRRWRRWSLCFVVRFVLS